jgi:Xaa-Pro dipeptidase
MDVVFRQSRYFYYLSGVDLPNCVVTYDIEKDRLIIFIPRPNTGTSVIFNGPSPTPEEIQAKYDVDAVTLTDTLPAYLNYFAHREQGLIYVAHGYDIPKGIIPQNFTFSDGYQSNLYISPWESTKLKPAIDAARTIKSAYEIKMLRKANAITAQAHINVLRHIRHLINETEVEAIFTATCIAQQAKRQAYSVIAGSGENASTLHYSSNNEPLKGRQLLCLDAGCEWDCYASDVTRTFPISGTFTPEAKAIYDIVAEMQDSCISLCKAGVNYTNIHLHAHLVAVLGLKKLGLLHNGTDEEIYRSGVSVAFFPHGVSSFQSFFPCNLLIYVLAGPFRRS